MQRGMYSYKVPGLCGVCYIHRDGGRQWLPLVSLTAHATICQSSSRLVLKQEFVNPGSTQIDEAAYSFPIYESAAIVAFTCRIQDRIIQGVVREKDKARQIYEHAKEKGQQAALMLQNQADVWSTRISNIPAAGKVEVEITTVCELKHDAQVDGIRFVLPTNIAPQYGSRPDNLPPSIDQQAGGGIRMTVAVTMAAPITSLQSPSHPIAVGIGSHIPNQTLLKDPFDVCKGYVTLSQNTTFLDKDFVVLVVSADVGKPQAILETHPKLPNSQRALLLSLVPKFDMPRIRPEIIFIADRSGSMDDKVVQLRNSLKVFLKSLPVGVKFNICSFGSRHDFLWPKGRPYDQNSLDAALKHVEKFQADYGGTEIFRPVEEALKIRYKDLQTEIIILTDGQIWQTQPLFDLVQKECESGDVRVFSLGIGDSVSHALVEGLARAGSGYAQIVGTEDNLDVKLVRMLRAALGAHVSNYRLLFPDSPEEKEDKEGFQLVEHDQEDTDVPMLDSERHEESSDSKPKEVITLYDTSSDRSYEDETAASPEDRFAHLPPFQPPSRLEAPFQIPPLFPFSRTNVYVLLSGSQATPKSVTVQGTNSSGDKLELEVPVTDIGIGTTVHQLAAQKLLQELEEGGSYLHSGLFGVDPSKDGGKFVDWVEREGRRVGTTFGVAGKWTSFVAVENVEELEQQMQVQSGSRGTDFTVFGGASTQQAQLLTTGKCGAYKPFVFGQTNGSSISTQSLTSAKSAKKSPFGIGNRFRAAEDAKISWGAYGSQNIPAFGCSPAAAHFGSLGTPVSDNVRVCGYAGPPSQQPQGGAVFGSAPQIEQKKSGSGSSISKMVQRLFSPKPAGSVSQSFSWSSSDIEAQSTVNFGKSFDRSSSCDRRADSSISEKRSEESRTYELLNAQGFDGSFHPGSGGWATEVSLAFHTWMQQEGDQDTVKLRGLEKELVEKLIASAVAIAIFEEELKGCKEIWVMIVEKTGHWGVTVVGEAAWKAVKVWASHQLAMADEQKKQSFWVIKKE